ncbi:MAG: amidohydrolase family protein [Candidatus Binatia bacterium]
MIVDAHAHLISPSAIDMARREPDTYGVHVTNVDGTIRLRLGDQPPIRPLLEPLYTLGAYLSFMRSHGITGALMGPLMDAVGYHLPPRQGQAWSRVLNEGLAETLKAADLRVLGLASVPLQDPSAAAAELRHAVLSLEFRGAMIDTNMQGRALGDTAFDPFWRTAVDLGVPVVLHPYWLESVPRFNDYYLHNLVGYPFETTLAACSLIFGSTLERMPELTVVLVHGGGFFPYQVGRFDHGHQVRPEPRSRGAGPASRYMRRFYYDTITHSRQSLRFLCDAVGADRLLLGSDYPFPLGDPEPVRAVREAKLGEIAERAALGGNAMQIFRLEV